MIIFADVFIEKFLPWGIPVWTICFILNVVFFYFACRRKYTKEIYGLCLGWDGTIENGYRSGEMKIYNLKEKKVEYYKYSSIKKMSSQREMDEQQIYKIGVIRNKKIKVFIPVNENLKPIGKNRCVYTPFILSLFAILIMSVFGPIGTLFCFLSCVGEF